MLLRFLIVPLAAVMAMATAIISLMILSFMNPVLISGLGEGLASFTSAFFNALDQQGGAAIARAGVAVTQGIKILALATLAPSVLMALLTEFTGLRAWFVHVLGMAFLTAVLPLASLDARIMEAGGRQSLIILLALTGCAAGTVYWLIAGRGAGSATQQLAIQEPLNGG